MARHPPAQRCEGITYTAAEVVFDRLQLCLHHHPPPPPATVGGGDGGRRRILEMRRRWRGRTAEHMAVRMSVKNHTPPLKQWVCCWRCTPLCLDPFPLQLAVTARWSVELDKLLVGSCRACRYMPTFRGQLESCISVLRSPRTSVDDGKRGR